MRALTILAVVIAGTAAFWDGGISPAQAAKKKQLTEFSSQTVVTAPRRPRITVQRRSFLDAGTEVLPGERKFTDYAIPPYYSAYDVLGPGRNFDRQPLNSPWESGGARGW